MVSTRGKKKTGRSNKTLVENEAAENALAVAQTSDSLPVNVEEGKPVDQFDDKAEISVDEARNKKYEEMIGQEENVKGTKVDNDAENKTMTEINGDNNAESEQSTSEDDELDDQEGVMWEDDEDYYEEDTAFDEDEVIEDGATEEENDDEDEVGEEEATEDEDDGRDEVSGEEETEEEDDEENTQEEKEFAKGDGREAEAKEVGREAKEHHTEKVEVNLRNIKKSSERSRKKKVQTERSEKVDAKVRADRFEKVDAKVRADRSEKVDTKLRAERFEKVDANVRADRSEKVEAKDKPESSRKRKLKKRVEGMGMIFMCSSKTKNDCYQYRVLGLPESKKDMVEKIYTGMRLFLYDVDLKLMYGIYKAVGPGGYNIEPKAFKSQFPSQVRFTVLDDCLPLPEEKFKKVMTENYYTNTKFDCQLNSEQVKKLCRLFLASSKGNRSKRKVGRIPKTGKLRPRPRERVRRPRAGDGPRVALRDEARYHDRPRKRPRKVLNPVSPVRRPPPPLPSTVPPYVYDRASDVDAYRRDPYLARRSPPRDRHDPLLNRRDPYRDVQDPPIRERHDHYREERDPYPERHYSYREERDPYRDPYRDGRDPYLKRHDSYRDARDSYLERSRDPYIESRDSYRDGQDSYLERGALYRDIARSEPYSSYRRDPLPVHRDVYREDPVVEYRDPYPLGSEARFRHDIGSRDSYVSKRERPSLAEPVYASEYASRGGLARVYRL